MGVEFELEAALLLKTQRIWEDSSRDVLLELKSAIKVKK